MRLAHLIGVLLLAASAYAGEPWLVGGPPLLPEAASGAPRTISLTFDDGPVPGASEVLLDALRAHGWHATFCVLGSQVAKHPELARRMIDEGHELANHSWSHRKPTDLDDATLLDEVDKATAAIVAATGVKPGLYRPPYLALLPAQGSLINRTCGLLVLTETWNSLDWQRPPPGAVRERMLSGIPNGSIVLAHESFPQSVAEMPGIIAELAARGYRSVTVSALRNVAGRQP
jgi:peptidoglycan/xylan/chitin deacetylase (PgdA/CDA1 family)